MTITVENISTMLSFPTTITEKQPSPFPTRSWRLCKIIERSGRGWQDCNISLKNTVTAPQPEQSLTLCVQSAPLAQGSQFFLEKLPFYKGAFIKLNLS